MLTSFDAIACCFNSEDEDDEKFEIKHKKERKVSYRPDAIQTKQKKKRNKKKNLSLEQKDKFFKDPVSSNKKFTIDFTQYKLEKKKFGIEYDYGNVEYKLKLCDVDMNRIEELTTQMKFRLEEGGGKCFYEIGVEDNGNSLGISKEELEISVNVIYTIATNLNYKAKIMKLIQGQKGLIAEILIKRQEDTISNKIEVNMEVVGDEGSGKSSLIGVLINGKLDNGKGSARTGVFRHKHEILCGKTSSVSHQILGFDDKGEPTNYGDLLKPSFAEIVSKSTKIINFYDMAGRMKSFNKTTASTLSNEYLDYIILVISAKDGITKNTEELLSFIVNLNVPVISVINKIDLIKEDELKKIVNEYKKTIKKLNLGKNPIVMKCDDDIALFSRNIEEQYISLIFLTSALTWEGGLTLFKNFLGVLPENHRKGNEEKQKEIEMEKTEFDIHEVINRNDYSILTGIVANGKLRANTKFYLGPDIRGSFKTVEVTDIHCKKVSVGICNKGQYGSVCVKTPGKINTLGKDYAKKGMVLLDIRINLVSYKLFEIELWTIDGTTKTFKRSYQPVINIKHIRQVVKIKDEEELFLFLGDNKKQNMLEKLVNNENINLFNVKKKIEEITQLKKSRTNSKSNFICKKILDNKINNDEIVIGPPEQKTRLVVEFMFNPEYISVGQNIIINDSSLKAYGVITKIFK